MADNRYGRDEDRGPSGYGEGGYGARGYEGRGAIDDRFDQVARTRQEAFDEEARAEGRIDARTGDRMGPGDSRAGQFEPGARGGEGWGAQQGSRAAWDDLRYEQRGRSSASGLQVFDRSLQATHIWLNEIIDELGPDKQVAWHALTGVLRAIRDRVPVELAVHLGAQLPLLIRGAYYDQFRLAWDPERTRNFDEFLDSIADHLRGIGRPINPRAALYAVARVLSRHISEGQVRKVVDALPRQVQWSWEDACRGIRGPDEEAARGWQR